MIKKKRKIKYFAFMLIAMTLFAFFFPTTTTSSHKVKAEGAVSERSYTFRNLTSNTILRDSTGYASLQYQNANVWFSFSKTPYINIDISTFYGGQFFHFNEDISLTEETSSGIKQFYPDMSNFPSRRVPFAYQYDFNHMNFFTGVYMYRIVYKDYSDSLFASDSYLNQFGIIPVFASFYNLNVVRYEYYFSELTDQSYIAFEFPFLNIDPSDDKAGSSFSNAVYKTTPFYFYSETTNIDYDTVYQEGKTNGYEEARKKYQNSGYQEGFDKGYALANNNSFLTLLDAVFYAPIKGIVSLFDFNLLGFNLLTFVKAIFTVVVLLSVVHLIL